MESTVALSDQNIKKGLPETLLSPRNAAPMEVVYLSNIDQTVPFSVETIYFYESPQGVQRPTPDIVEMVKSSVSEVLLIPYYFMAGRLNFNLQTCRLELICNNAGVPFVGASSTLRLIDLGNLSQPNPSFEHLILRNNALKSLEETPIFSIQVTRFECGGFSIGFSTNHCILDGKSAVQMLESFASVCRGEGIRTHELIVDRSCLRARDPLQIKYNHTDYIKLADTLSLTSSFTSPIQSSPPSLSSKPPETHNYKLFYFTPHMIRTLKEKSGTKRCSTFEAIVAHLWRARTKAVFDDPDATSSVLFAVDIRSKVSPPLPKGFIGNAVITASASATLKDLQTKPFSHCVGMVREAVERVNDDYVRSVIDWLEVHKGVPSAVNGNFYVSAWWKLPLHELDLGWGKPLYGGPVVSGMDEFVLLLSAGNVVGGEGGIDVWIALERERMERFMCSVFEM